MMIFLVRTSMTLNCQIEDSQRWARKWKRRRRMMRAQ
jgi:hypothetical protein